MLSIDKKLRPGVPYEIAYCCSHGTKSILETNPDNDNEWNTDYIECEPPAGEQASWYVIQH